jgi:L-ascorbate metabolism protein UlaG (beta-lactamase superfamily)
LLKSDHFDGVRFFNPTGANGQPFSKLPQLIRTPQARWPTHIDVTPRRPPALDGAAVVVTFIGHSTWLIQTSAGNLLTDPMYSRRAGPLNLLGPRRVRVAAVPFEDLPQISTVLLSHNHYDHCDLPTLRRLARRFNPVVVTPIGNRTLVRSAGISRVEERDWWERVQLASVEITVTPAQHFSARGPFDRNRALWGGFRLATGRLRLYFAGDTGYGPFFREIRQRLGPTDLALLPIGAYEPRWFMKDIHMNPAEAVQAHLDLEAAQSLGMHYGTFQLTPEAMDDPLIALDQARRSRNLQESRFRTLEFGESFRVPRNVPEREAGSWKREAGS